MFDRFDPASYLGSIFGEHEARLAKRWPWLPRDTRLWLDRITRESKKTGGAES